MKKLAVASLIALTMNLPGLGGVSAAYAARLSPSDCDIAIADALAQANIEPSGFRPADTTQMHIACVDRRGRLIRFRSMHDAWTGSIDIAIAKAFTAAAFSSNENALTTRDIGVASQPGGPLWQIGNSNQVGTPGSVKNRGIIEFPGGVPLYKDGELVGGLGVSGDGVDQDEDVAEAGSCDFLPNPAIRSDTVVGLPYTAGGVFDFRVNC